jgi:hypothetical protein
MDATRANDTVENPEILPPADEPRSRRAGRKGRRFVEAFGPLAAGVLIDGADFVTFGPIGIMFGMLVGGTLAYVLTSVYRLPVWQRLLWAVGTGVYCAMPRTEFVPVATLVAAVTRFWQGGSRS